MNEVNCTANKKSRGAMRCDYALCGTTALIDKKRFSVTNKSQKLMFYVSFGRLVARAESAFLKSSAGPRLDNWTNSLRPVELVNVIS